MIDFLTSHVVFISTALALSLVALLIQARRLNRTAAIEEERDSLREQLRGARNPVVCADHALATERAIVIELEKKVDDLRITNEKEAEHTIAALLDSMRLDRFLLDAAAAIEEDHPDEAKVLRKAIGRLEDPS